MKPDISILLFLLASSALAFHSKPSVSCKSILSRRVSLRMNAENVPTKDDFRQLMADKNYGDAYGLLRRNPMIQLTAEEGQQLLNNLEVISSSQPAATRRRDNNRDNGNGLAPTANDQLVEATVFIYRRLERQKILRGFNCIGKDYPEAGMEVSPSSLESKTGLPLAALTPKNRTTYWQLAGMAMVLLEIWLGDAVLQIDPLTSLIPLTLLLFGGDQVFLKGAVFESFYQRLFPVYRRKIIVHEAGHILISYLLGLTVSGYVTNAWAARSKYPALPGSAGTFFYDSLLQEELSQNKVTRSSLDRMSIELMAGIAGEAVEFSVCEGGLSDEQALINLFTSINPPWNLLRIQGQARWAVLQAILLLKEHSAAFQAVIRCLEQDQGIGDIVAAIEANLPPGESLPVLQRQRSRQLRRKKNEQDYLLRFVQSKTWKVQGIQPAEGLGEGEGEGIEGAGIGAQTLIEPKEEVLAASMEAKAACSAEEPVVVAGQQAAVKVKEQLASDVEQFASRMRMLEEAVARGDLQLLASREEEGEGEPAAAGTEDKQKTKSTAEPGGIWLNGLKSYPRLQQQQQQPASSQPPAAAAAIEESAFFPFPAGNEGKDSTAVIAEAIKQPSPSKDWDVSSMLKQHRGYQIKELELLTKQQENKVKEIDETMQRLREQLQAKQENKQRVSV